MTRRLPRLPLLPLVLLNAPAHTPSAFTPTFTDRTDWKATRQYE